MNETLVLTESTYYILLSLVTPQHGYGIMQQTEQMSAGRVRLAAGTLYGALNALCDKGWIIQLPIEDGSRKKQYKLTDKGLQVLKGELDRLRQLVANGEAILKEDPTLTSDRNQLLRKELRKDKYQIKDYSKIS